MKPEAVEPSEKNFTRPFENGGIFNQEALKDLNTLSAIEKIFANADRRREEERRKREEAIKRLEEAGIKNVSLSDGLIQLASIPGARPGDLGNGWVADVSRDVKALLVKEGFAPADSIVIALDGDMWGAWDESADTLADELPNTSVTSRGGRHFVTIAPRSEGSPRHKITSRGHAVIQLRREADGSKGWTVAVYPPDWRTPGEREKGTEAQGSPTPQAEPAKPAATSPSTPRPEPQSEPSAPKESAKPRKTLKGADKVDDFLKDVGLLREASWNGNGQAGMLREGPSGDNAQRDKIIFGLPKLLDALLAANADMRTFEDFSGRLFGLLDSRGQRQAWEALKPYLQGAWLTVGNLRGDLDLDEPSRAEARAIFERVERGNEAQPQEVTGPATSETTQQAPAPQPAPTDWAGAKNGDIRVGQDGKAYIRWEDYWLEPATGKVRKWVGSRKRGRMETVEVEGVNVHDRLLDGRPGDRAMVFFEPDGKWTNPYNGKVHYGHMQALVDDPKNGYRWTSLDRWADDRSPYDDIARAKDAQDAAKNGTLGSNAEPRQQKENDNERTGIQSASDQVGGAVGGQESSRDGGDGVGGTGGTAKRPTPMPGGTDVPSGLAGNEPAPGVPDDGPRSSGRNGSRGDGGKDPGAQTPSVQSHGGDSGVGFASGGGGDNGDVDPANGGRGQGAAQGVQPSTQEPDHLSDDKTATANYVIPENENGGLDDIRNARDRIVANLAALRVLKALEKEGRQATRGEQRVLSLYTGWGSLGEQLFNEQNPDWAEERAELKSLLTEAEYVSARRTVQYAHYTPMDVVRGMYDALKAMGVRGANLSAFEAGLGVGRFVGGLPPELRGVHYTGVEMDPLTAAIAKQLYPQATVVNASYQDVSAPNGQYDFIVGNPPYGDIKLSDRAFPDGNGQTLHNFFIMKQIEALRPGGVAVFLVTHAFLDAKNADSRKWIAERAELLEAVRMPDNLFKAVDARVVTDIVIFRKRDKQVAYDPNRNGWVESRTLSGYTNAEGETVPDFNLSNHFKLKDEHAASNGFNARGTYSLRRNIANGDEWLATVSLRRSTRYGRDSAQTEMAIDGEASDSYIHTWLQKSGSPLDGAYVPRKTGAPTPEELRDRLTDQPIAKLGGGATHPSLMPGGHFVGADGKLYMAVQNAMGALSGREVVDYDEKEERARYELNPRRVKSGVNKGKPIAFDRWKDVADAYTKLTPKEREIMKALVHLREVRFDLAAEELKEDASEEVMSALRRQLNAAYDAFVEAARGYGGGKKKDPTLNETKIRTLMYADPASSQLLGLEIVERLANGKGVKSITKNAIFTKRVNKPAWKPLEHYATAVDAMLANLAASGRLDLNWIAGRIGKSAEETLKDLSGRVYLNPRNGAPVLAEAYLSGDVKTKLAEAEEAVNAGNAQYEANVEALRKVQPEDIAQEFIQVSFGNPILDEHFIGEFFAQQMGADSTEDISVFYERATGSWRVREAVLPQGAAVRFPSADKSMKEVMQAALNNKKLTVYDKKRDEYGREHSVPNEEATDEVNATIRQIRDLWDAWWRTATSSSASYIRTYRESHNGASPQTGDIGRDIARAYNDRFNRIVDATYDGTFLKFTGLNPAITPYKHQRDAVWRTILTNNVLYNHVVGSGKTNTAVFSIMEMRRMGRVRKPVVVVPNHLVEQWKKEFLEAYPGANVLATASEDFQAHNRKRFFGRIQNGDYDVIVIPHSQITRIPLSAKVTNSLVNDMLADYRAALEAAKREMGKDNRTVARIEGMIETLEKKIKRMMDATKTDDTGLFLDTLGIDALFLDESHEFKNVPFVSSVQAKGMGNPSGSMKAFDLLMKLNYFRKMKQDAPIVFMSGTPVSNSLTKLYLNMLYMAPDLLKQADITSMDAFLQAFGKVDDQIEMTLTGAFKSVTRLRKLVNIPEIMHMVRSYMDVVDAEDLRGSMEAVGRKYSVPTLEGGKPKLIIAKRSEEQAWYFGKVIRRSERENGSWEKIYNEGSIYDRSMHLPKDPSEDNMLKIINDAQMAALDMRLRQPDAPDFAGSKVNLCVAQVVADYKRFDGVKGTQMIFCDRSIPGSGLPEAKKTLTKLREDLRKARERLEQEENDPAAGAAFAASSSMEDESTAEKVARLEGEIREQEDYIESGGFSVYDDIRRKLIAAGIPENEIAFIHSAKDKDAKLAIFKKMNEGKIRVLLGSTSRMGAGTNANKRMVSLHHLDAPWRPSDMEQREGRIIRQGNLLMDEIPGFQVRIYRYGTEKTGDGGKYNTLEQKNCAFHGIFKADNSMREMDDVLDDDSAEFERMKAELSGSTLMPLLSQMRKDFEDLDRRMKNYNVIRRNTEEAIENSGAEADTLRNRIALSKRLKEAATAKPESKDNYYAGVELVPHGAAPQTFDAKTIKDRMATPGAKTFAQMVEEGGSGSFIRYRGLTWVATVNIGASTSSMRFTAKDNEGKTVGSTTDIAYQNGIAGTIADNSILVRMDNQIDRADEAIAKTEKQLAEVEARITRLKEQFAEMPEHFAEMDKWLETKREIEWLNKAVNADCETGKEARNYFDKSFPGKVPDYEWTTPEWDKKMGRGEEAESPVGSLREAASVPFGELERWGRTLDNYEAGRLSLNRPVTVLNRTPEIIRRVIEEVGGKQFANDRPITMRVENLDKITGMDIYTRSGKHNIPVSELRKLQLELDNPVAIFVSDTRPDTSLVILTELVDKAEGDAKAIVALQYAYHPNGNWMSLNPLRTNLLSSAYGGKSAGTIKKWAVRAKGKDFLLKYVNTGKAGSWEEATRLQLPFAHGALASIAGQSDVLTEKDFSMDDKGKVLKGGKLVNPKDVGMTRENGAWEKDLAKRLAKRGLTEDDLSPDAQAYLRARRARTEAQPTTRREKVAAFVGEAIHPHEGETRRAFAKRKAVAAADFVTRKMVDVRAPLIQAQREIAGETLRCRMSIGSRRARGRMENAHEVRGPVLPFGGVDGVPSGSGRARCGAASALPPSRMSDSCVRRRFRGDVAHQWCSGEVGCAADPFLTHRHGLATLPLPTFGPVPLGFRPKPSRLSGRTP